jgi:hypothetical protein
MTCRRKVSKSKIIAIFVAVAIFAAHNEKIVDGDE